MDRDTLSRLSCALHLLEKQIINKLHLGWEEQNFKVFCQTKDGGSYKNMRPDAFCLEKIHLGNQRFLILDIKLSASSTPLAIYKYLPLFENGFHKQKTLTDQLTFFPEWLPESASNTEPISRSDLDGQLDVFLENNILFLCYLVGDPLPDLFPGETISSLLPNNGRKKKVKRIPHDMEVRFLHFTKLPEFYCRIAGIEYTQELQEKTHPIMEVADKIKEVTLSSPPDANQISKDLYSSVKSSSLKTLR